MSKAPSEPTPIDREQRESEAKQRGDRADQHGQGD